MATKVEEEIINQRADELEKLGFEFKVKGSNCWYEKDGVKMIPTLMMCVSTQEWNKFIEENSTTNHDPHPKG